LNLRLHRYERHILPFELHARVLLIVEKTKDQYIIKFRNIFKV
jgi:hypothetical protein